MGDYLVLILAVTLAGLAGVAATDRWSDPEDKAAMAWGVICGGGIAVLIVLVWFGWFDR